MSPGLQLSLSEYEQNEAEKGDYLAFVATTSQYGFAGRTLFWVSRDYLESFISELDALDATLRGEARLRCGWGDDVLFELAILSEGHGGRLSQTRYAQPALFALEWALAELWGSRGITPDVVMGHSLGEHVAACEAHGFAGVQFRTLANISMRRSGSKGFTIQPVAPASRPDQPLTNESPVALPETPSTASPDESAPITLDLKRLRARELAGTDIDAFRTKSWFVPPPPPPPEPPPKPTAPPLPRNSWPTGPAAHSTPRSPPFSRGTRPSFSRPPARTIHGLLSWNANLGCPWKPPPTAWTRSPRRSFRTGRLPSSSRTIRHWRNRWPTVMRP